MELGARSLHGVQLPAFDPPHRLGWPYVAYLVGWIVSRTQEPEHTELIQEALPSLLDLPTNLERRNELTRRILRILVNPMRRPAPAVDEQTAAYWLGALAADHRSGAYAVDASVEDKDDELAKLCRQFGEVAI